MPRIPLGLPARRAPLPAPIDPEGLVLAAGARLIGVLPARLRARLAGPPRVVDGQTVHPDVQLVLRALSLGGGETFETKPVAEGGRELRRRRGPRAAHLSRSSEEFTGHAVNSSQNKALRGVCEKYLLIAGSVTRIPRERS